MSRLYATIAIIGKLIIFSCISLLSAGQGSVSSHSILSKRIEINPVICCPPYTSLSCQSMVWTVGGQINIPAGTGAMSIESAIRYHPALGHPSQVVISDERGQRLYGTDQVNVLFPANITQATLLPFPSTTYDFIGFIWRGYRSQVFKPNAQDTLIRYRIQYIWDLVPSTLCRYIVYGALWNSHRIGTTYNPGVINILDRSRSLYCILNPPTDCNSLVGLKWITPCTGTYVLNPPDFWFQVIGNGPPPINIIQHNDTLPPLPIGTYTMYVTDSNATPVYTDTSVFTIDPPTPPLTLDSAVACNTYTWPVNGVTYTHGGYYTFTFINGSGCLEVKALQLTLNQSNSNTTHVLLPPGGNYLWPINGVTYMTAGTYTHTMLNANGCVDNYVLLIDLHASIPTLSQWGLLILSLLLLCLAVYRLNYQQINISQVGKTPIRNLSNRQFAGRVTIWLLMLGIFCLILLLIYMVYGHLSRIDILGSLICAVCIGWLWNRLSDE